MEDLPMTGPILLVQTEDGGFLLVGETGSFGIGGGYENMYIVKTDVDGGL
jgi:hypothetical protein